VSPSKAVCGGDSAFAKPSIPGDATLAASGLVRRALVATTPIVVWLGAAKRPSASPVARVRAESISRRPLAESRVPASSAPVSGSRNSPGSDVGPRWYWRRGSKPFTKSRPPVL
jgi:hypothetical protein